MLSTALLMLCAVLLDRLLGEPRRFHPLAGFGNYAVWLEHRLNTATISQDGGRAGRLAGILAWSLAVLPVVALATAFWWLPAVRPYVDVLALYLALGMQSLREHALRVQQAMQAGDLPLSRQRVGEIVSRDTAFMRPPDVARAAVESVLENGNDAVFGALFWFALLGAPGALLFRLANTLDAMWGYRTSRYVRFGWAAARIDDLLNFVPARLTALSYALLGRTRHALQCWRQQARAWESPNAGPVMASGAGSLGVQLGGAAQYQGMTEERPALGAGSVPQAADIARAIRLVERGIWLWLALLVLLGVAQNA